MITAFKDIHSINSPHFISVEAALERIKNGKSKGLVEDIRNEKDKKKRNELKKSLPSIIFGGKFRKRTDDGLESPSGYMTLDFDGFKSNDKMLSEKLRLSKDKFIYAVWVSPSGEGLKALVRVPRNSHKFKNYFFALMDYFDIPEGDMSCQNISRVTYESYDPDIYINKVSDVFTNEIHDIKKHRRLKKLRRSDYIYDKLKDWLNNYDTFEEGNRNQYLFKLLCAMNRFGIERDEAEGFVSEFIQGDFDSDEVRTTVNNVYDNYSSDFNTVKFDDDRSFSDGVAESFETRDSNYVNPIELVVNPKITSKKLHQFYNGELKRADPTGSAHFDRFMPFKRNEFYFLVGAAKVGKTTATMYILTMSAKFADWCWIICSTENEDLELRHLIVSYIAGTDCKQDYKNKREKIDAAEKFFDEHFIVMDAAKVRSFEDHVVPVYNHFKSVGKRIDAILIDPLAAISAPMSYGKATGGDEMHSRLAEDYKKFAISECSLFLVAHTRTEQQRDGYGSNRAPYPSDAKHGAVYFGACHVALTYHRNVSAEKGSREFYSTEVRVYAQRTAFTKGGELSTDNKLKIVYNHEPFGFDIEYDGSEETNPLLPLESYYPSKVESTGELRKFPPTQPLEGVYNPNNGFDNIEDEFPFDKE